MAKLKKVYLGIIILFLYAPILVLIAQSFNASRYRGQWTGFTLQWYEKLFTSEDIIEAFLNTLTIGLTAAFFATLLGLITALAIRNLSKKSQLVFRGLANVPLLNADIVTGIALMLLFLGFGLAHVWAARDPTARARPILAMQAVFFFGGLARIGSWLAVGPPGTLFIFLGALELIIPPFVWWGLTKLER